MGSRRKARESAMQLLYQYDLTESPLLSAGDIVDWPRFCLKLTRESRQAGLSPGRRIMELLPKEARQIVLESANKFEYDPTRRSVVIKALNDLLLRRDFYQPKDFENVVLTAEARALLSQKSTDLSDREVERLNRLLLEASFPQELAKSQQAPQQSIDELLRNYWQNLRENADEDVQRYATRLVRGALDHLEEIDRRIASHATHWRLPRMASVDRNILRVAVYEMVYEPDTPKVVIIDEAIEIARRYSSYEATHFINGLLDAIRRDLEGQSPPQTRQSRDS